MSYEIAIGLDKFLSSAPLCPYADFDYMKWYWYVNYMVFGAFVFVAMTIVMKLMDTTPGPDRIPYYLTLNIVTMGMIAVIMMLY